MLKNVINRNTIMYSIIDKVTIESLRSKPKYKNTQIEISSYTIVTIPVRTNRKNE